MVEDPVRMVEESRKNASWRGYDPYYWRQLANLLCWTGAADQSIVPIRKAIEAAPRQQMLIRELLVNLCEAGKYDEALEELNKARAAGIRHPYVDRGEGLVHMCLENYSQAQDALDRTPGLNGGRVMYGPRLLQGSVEAAAAGWQRERASVRSARSLEEEHQLAEHLAGTYFLTDREALSRTELASCPDVPECPPNARRFQSEMFWAWRLRDEERMRTASSHIARIATRWPNGFTVGMQRYVGALGARAAGDLDRAEALVTESAGLAFSVLTLMDAAEIAEAAGKLDLADEYWARFEQRKGTVLKLWFPGLILLGWRRRMHLASRRGDGAQVRRCAEKILKHWGVAQPQIAMVREARSYVSSQN
jgi:tetratricopeptide (TPR) repeat protein